MMRKKNSSVRLSPTARAKNMVSKNETTPQLNQQYNLLFGVQHLQVGLQDMPQNAESSYTPTGGLGGHLVATV